MHLSLSPRPKGRRSKTRLGRTYEATTPALRLELSPVVGFWQRKGGKVPGLLLLAAMLWVVNQFFVSDAFYVYEVTVRGNTAIPAAEIYQASGLDGFSIFYLDPHQVEAAVSSLPNIKEAKVHYQLPAVATIEVVERRPQIVWCSETQYWIDAEGTILLIRGELPSDVTLVQDLDGRALRSGDRIDPGVLEAIQNLRSALPEVAVFQYSSRQGVSFFTPQGWPVYLGLGDRAEAKAAILRALLRELEAEGLQPEFLDLRFEGRPYYRAGPV
jgi:cell division septal protein FtsQ